jgi:hypothetical protein
MARGRPATIDQVIERMRAIDAELSPRDGVACFNRLYLRVTENIQAAVAGGQFKSSAFLERLDVVFAGFYLDAYRASRRAGGRVPRAWAPLFEARRRRTVAPIQFALAGMNAHINHDLVLAIVDTCTRNKMKVSRDTPFHRDYLAVNKLLAKVEERIKREFLTGDLAVADEALGRLDDVLAMWSVEAARDAAWNHAEALSNLPPFAREPYLDALAGVVGLAGRGLLVRIL